MSSDEVRRDGGGQSTLELVHFENIRDQGIIETPTAYAMLLEVQPRDWLTLSEDKRSNIYVAYVTYLRGLTYPTQILSMTVPFDAEDYYEQFARVPDIVDKTQNSTADAESDEAEIAAPDGGVAPLDAVGDSPLLEFGRLTHVEWLQQMLTDGQVRDRRFFVAVGLKKGEAGDEASEGLLNTVREKISLGGSVREVVDEEPYLDEVWARAHRVASQLPRTQVSAEVLDSREEVLGVLYHSFRGTAPSISFDHASFTRADDATTTDPETGEAIDFEAAFEAADSEDIPAEPELPKRDETPYEGRVAPEYVNRVDQSRILQWYVRNIAPLGVGTNSSTPLTVYGGVVTFLLAVLLGVGAFLAFTATGSASSRATYWLLREGSFVLMAGALPVFLGSLVIFLPSSRKSRVAGLVGAGIVGVAIYLFQISYPALWDSSDMGRTTLVLEVYGAGLLLLVGAVGLAVRQRRAVLDTDERDEPDAGVDSATADD